MQRIKAIAALAWLGVIYVFAAWQVAHAVMDGKVQARSGGWITLHDEPTLFSVIASLFALLVLTGPILVYWGVRGERISRDRLRMLDRRRLLDGARRQTLTGEDL